ncbi:MAG: hypothetical protein AAGB93_01470 [Planctomycetota bacterium]
MSGDEFYIGWEERTAPALSRFTRAKVLALVALGVVVAALVAATQQPFASSRFEFGVVRSFEGRVEFVPYPTLVVQRPGEARGSVAPESRWLLTVFGKFGAEAAFEGMDGHRVRFDGSLIDRDGVTMVEVLPDSVEDGGAEAPTVAFAEPTREVTLRGEIVDSKCYLGVMKPGNLKTHRACAARCISGGVPPVLLVRQGDGAARYVLLVDARGGAVNDRVLDMVAEPVEITGALSDLGGLELLRADPAAYRRLAE